MSTEYLIPKLFFEEIETFLTKDKKSISFNRFKKYASFEFKRWLEERDIPLKFLSYVYNNHLAKIVMPNCPICGKELSFDQIIKNCRFCSRKCVNSSEDILLKSKKKRTETCLEKYGVENPSQLKEIREKQKQTNLEKYGVNNPNQSKVIKEKQKQTLLEKYGVENPSQLKEFRDTAIKTRRSNHWEKFCSILKEKYIIPTFSKKEYINDTGRNFKCLKCNKIFDSEGCNGYLKVHKNKDGSCTTLIPYAIFCPHCMRSKSKKEKEVLEYVKSIYNGLIVENDRIQLDGKELDIFLPKLNLGIEFNGDYWHSLKIIKERDIIKSQLCKQKGIRLFRIQEKEWDNNPEKIEKEIKELLLSKV